MNYMASHDHTNHPAFPHESTAPGAVTRTCLGCKRAVNALCYDSQVGHSEEPREGAKPRCWEPQPSPGENVITVSGTKIYFPSKENPVVVGSCVMFPDGEIDNEITWGGVTLRIPTDMTAEHEGAILRVYRMSDPPEYCRRLRDNWPLLSELKGYSNGTNLSKSHGNPILDTTREPREVVIYVKGTKLYFPATIKPSRYPSGVDFTASNSVANHKVFIKCRRGSAELILGGKYMVYYVKDGIRVCEKISSNSDINGKTKASSSPSSPDLLM